MSNYTPRHLRKHGHSRNNGSVGPEKKQAFKRAKQISDQFIHQSASALDKMTVRYAAYCRAADAGVIRKVG